MTTILAPWGNSLGVRLPKGVTESAGLQEGDRVVIAVERGTVVIRPAKPKYTLEDLLEGLTPEMLHEETDTGVVGAEDVW